MSRVIDAVLQLTDKFTRPAQAAMNTMTSFSRAGVAAGRKIDKAGQSINRVGRGLTASFTLPLAGAGAASLKTAADFEAAMSNVEAITGSTGKEMESLTELAKDLGAETAWSAIEVAEAMTYTGMAGWTAQDNINGLAGILDLASASGTALAETSDILTDAITAFGDSSADAGRYADVMTKACTSANTNVELLGESYKYVGALSGTMGYAFDQVTTALAVMANSGIKGSQAGTALKNAIANLAAPTDKMQTAMDKLGLSITNSDGTMKSFEDVIHMLQGAFRGLSEDEQAAYAKTIFGKEAMAGMLAVINTSAEEYDALAAAIDGSAGAAEKAAGTQLDNLSGQMTLLKSAAESFAITIGEKLTPHVSKFVEWVQRLTDRLNAMDSAQVDAMIRFALMAAAIGPAVMMFGKLVSGVGRGVMVFNRMGMAVKAAGGLIALMSGPVGIVIAVIAALVVVVMAVVKHFDVFKQALAPFAPVFQVIRDNVAKLMGAFQGMAPVIGSAVDAIGAMIAGLAGVFAGALGTAFAVVTELILMIQGVFDGLIQFVTGVFTGNWEAAWNGVVTIFSSIFEGITGVAKAVINGVSGAVNAVISAINGAGFTIPDWVPVVGGKAFQLNIPLIPTLAGGTDFWKGGLVQVSERGGEIIDLPRGSRVYPHDASVRMAREDGYRKRREEQTTAGTGGGVHIAKLADSIVVREEADIDRLTGRLVQKIREELPNMA